MPTSEMVASSSSSSTLPRHQPTKASPLDDGDDDEGIKNGAKAAPSPRPTCPAGGSTSLASTTRWLLAFLALLMVLPLAAESPPTGQPTKQPTQQPSEQPTTQPSRQPTSRPSIFPTTFDPKLKSFDFNYGTGGITLTFDQFVNPTTFDVTKLRLQSTQKYRENSTQVFKISSTFNSLQKETNNTQVGLYLTSDDYARLKLLRVLGSSNMTTFVTLGKRAVKQASGKRYNQVINSTIALRVSVLTPDTLPPVCQKYSIDMNAGTMNLTFSEPLNSSYFHLVGMAFQSVSNNFLGTGAYVQLVDHWFNYSFVDTYNRVVRVTLGATNLNLINTARDLCRLRLNCWLAPYAPFAKDMAGNMVSLIGFDTNAAMNPVIFVPDTTPPKLVAWSFSFNTGVLDLVFNEVVDVGYFNYSAITIAANRTLGPGTATRKILAPQYGGTYEAYSTFVNVTFTFDELNKFKNQYDVLKSRNTAWLVLDSAACTDVSEAKNIYRGLDATAKRAMAVSTLQQDTIPPIIASYSLDMSAQLLSLTFSEIVLISSFQLRQTGIQKTSTFSTARLPFDSHVGTGAPTVPGDYAYVKTKTNAVVVDIQLTALGFATIKQFATLGVSPFSTFLYANALLVTDLGVAPNALVPISQYNARAVTTYVVDTVRPYLLSWAIDMGLGVLHLNWSEPLNTTSFNMGAITLASDAVAAPVRTPASKSWPRDGVHALDFHARHLSFSLRNSRRPRTSASSPRATPTV